MITLDIIEDLCYGIGKGRYSNKEIELRIPFQMRLRLNEELKNKFISMININTDVNLDNGFNFDSIRLSSGLLINIITDETQFSISEKSTSEEKLYLS